MFAANIYTKGKWFFYNFAAGSFHKKKLYIRLYSTEIEFYSQKKTNSLFEPLFVEFGVTHALYLHKARGCRTYGETDEEN